MSLGTLTNLAVIVASGAIVLAVVYLSRFLRRYPLATRSDSSQELTRNTVESLLDLGGSAEASAFLHRALHHPDGLGPEDQLRAHLLHLALIRRMDHCFLQHRAGLFDDEIWSAYQAEFRKWIGTPGLARWLSENRSLISASLQVWLLKEGVFSAAVSTAKARAPEADMYPLGIHSAPSGQPLVPIEALAPDR